MNNRMTVPGPSRAAQLPSQLPQAPAPDVKTIADAVAHMHDLTRGMDAVVARLAQIVGLGQEPPDMHTVILNPAGNQSAPYPTVDIAKWEARSLGILNPTAFPVTIGVGGVSVAANSRAPQCPPQAALVLPLRCWDMEFGSTGNLGNTAAVIYVFRYRTLQPLMLGDMS